MLRNSAGTGPGLAAAKMIRCSFVADLDGSHRHSVAAYGRIGLGLGRLAIIRLEETCIDPPTRLSLCCVGVRWIRLFVSRQLIIFAVGFPSHTERTVVFQGPRFLGLFEWEGGIELGRVLGSKLY